MTLEPGLEPAFGYTVTEADTAAAIGSGEVPVLATPRVLALAERATVAAVAGALQAGATTVGTRVELDHLAPSLVGADLAVEAVLELLVVAERGIGAPATHVYRCIADFERHHPRFLPSAFSQFRVEEGGVGAGTVHSFKMTAGGRGRRFQMRGAQPGPWRGLTGVG